MGRTEKFLAAAACLLVGAFYLWTVLSTGDKWQFGPEQRDYYNRLIDGWLEGQLHMKVDVPEALTALANPYDPAQRTPGLGLHDASFYRGRYYLYFGAAPMVTLMLPFRVLTGTDLPLPVAVLVFVYVGFLASVAVWLAVKTHFFSETGTGVTIAAIAVLGLGNAGPILLRRPDMWELPIAGGFCFAMLMLGCVWCSLLPGKRRGWWWTGAGLCLGLAIASRPTYLLASPCLLIPLLAEWRRERCVPWLWLGRVVLPLALIGAAMAWHNQARFGSPLQFGQAYQLSLDYESKLPHFGTAYVPYNVRLHFFAGADWTRYFPFIRGPDLGTPPPGYTIHRGDVYGILANFPLAWLAWLVPLALWRRSAAERDVLGAWLGTAAVLGALAAGVMLSFFSALARYQGEFMPTFMLLAVVGLLALERWARLTLGAGWQRAVRSAWGAAAIGSAIFGMLYSLQFDRLLKEQNPALERKLARALNRIPATWEKLTGRAHGAVELSLRLPAERRPGDETLLTVGEPPRVDRVFLRERPDGQVQLGLVPAGAPELVGTPVKLTAGGEHRLRVALGSLLPPVTHPFFAGWSDDEVRRTVRQVRIELDGAMVLEGHSRSRDAVENTVRVGSEAPVAPAYPRFRGTLDGLRRIAVSPPPARASDPLDGAGDTLRLRVRFPTGRGGQREPLVVTGKPGAGDIVLVEYVDERTARLGLDNWGAPLRRSAPFPIKPGEVYELVITMASLRQVPDATLVAASVRGRVHVTVDGVVVWDEESDFYPAEAGEVVVGRNAIGGSTCGPQFTGELRSVERVGRE